MLKIYPVLLKNMLKNHMLSFFRQKISRSLVVSRRKILPNLEFSLNMRDFYKMLKDFLEEN